jgi:hypothetical protein
MAEQENNGAPPKDKDIGPASRAGEGAASGNGQAPPVLAGVPDEISPGSYRKHKRLALAGLLLAMVCNGAVSGPFGSREHVIGSALCSIFVFVWCYYDALERQYPLNKTMKICIVLLPVVGFPVYAFRSRCLAGFKTVGWAILFLLLAAGTAGIGAGISKVAAATLPGRWL